MVKRIIMKVFFFSNDKIKEVQWITSEKPFKHIHRVTTNGFIYILS